MFKPNFKEFPRGELIKENETITLFSIFDFNGGAEELFPFLYGCKKLKCTVVFENENITVKPCDENEAYQNLLLSFYAMINNMIPIHTDSLKPVDMKILPTDDKTTIDYKNLLTNQLSWCNTTENVAFITGKAQKLYRAIIEKTARPQLVERCCNFPIDEQQYLVYCQSHNLSIEKKTELAEKHPAPDQTAKVSMKDRFAAAQAEADRRVAGRSESTQQQKQEKERGDI